MSNARVRSSSAIYRLAGGFSLVALFLAGPVRAQAPEPAPDPFRFVEWLGQDVSGFVRGVPSRRALYVSAGMTGLVLVLSPQDSELTEGAVDLAEHTFPTARRTLNEIGNIRSVRPVAVMLFLGSMLSDNRRFQDAAFTSLEAIIFSNLITNTLKTVVGRARPFQDEGAHHYRPFSGNTSFPSGHATTVFAFTSPWLLYYGNVPSYALFVLGAGTAFIRMADNAHWFTDVLAGTLIGFTTGYLLTRGHQRESSPVSVEPVVSATQAGISLRFGF